MIEQISNSNFKQSEGDKWEQCLKLAEIMCDFAQKQIEDGEITQSRLTLTTEIQKIRKERFENCPNHIKQKREEIERRYYEKLSEVIEICKRRSSNNRNRQSLSQKESLQSKQFSQSSSSGEQSS